MISTIRQGIKSAIPNTFPNVNKIIPNIPDTPDIPLKYFFIVLCFGFYLI